MTSKGPKKMRCGWAECAWAEGVVLPILRGCVRDLEMMLVQSLCLVIVVIMLMASS